MIEVRATGSIGCDASTARGQLNRDRGGHEPKKQTTKFSLTHDLA
jgi:hypothetical protein